MYMVSELIGIVRKENVKHASINTERKIEGLGREGRQECKREEESVRIERQYEIKAKQTYYLFGNTKA